MQPNCSFPSGKRHDCGWVGLADSFKTKVWIYNLVAKISLTPQQSSTSKAKPADCHSEVRQQQQHNKHSVLVLAYFTATLNMPLWKLQALPWVLKRLLRAQIESRTYPVASTLSQHEQYEEARSPWATVQCRAISSYASVRGCNNRYQIYREARLGSALDCLARQRLGLVCISHQVFVFLLTTGLVGGGEKITTLL